MQRTILAVVAAFLAAGCAATPKSLNPGDTVVDGASARAAAEPAPAPAPAPAADPQPTASAADDAAAAGSCDLVRVAFAFDSAQLDEPAMKALRKDAECLSRVKPPALLVEGHCDERGTTEYNIALGARRAEAVRRYLADLGVKTRFDTVSFGKELPLAQGSSESAWAQNRRAELKMPGDKRSDGQLVAGR